MKFIPPWDFKQYKSALKHDLAIAGYEKDRLAMLWADTCVLVLPCGRSAHIEAGWMAAHAKKELFIYKPSLTHIEPELMYKIAAGITDSLEELADMLLNH